MKLAGAGRILLWRGGSLWIGRAGEATEVHGHHAVQLTLAAPQHSVRLRPASGDWISCAAALIHADQPHAFAGDGQLVANIFVEPESRAGQALHRICSHAGITPLADEACGAEIAALFASYDCKATDTVLTACARAVVDKLTDIDASHAVLDARVERALQHVRAHIADGDVTLAAVAALIHLSPDRFRHLFLAQTGIRFRPYLLWLRIEIALAAYADHHKLTEAAQAGGFADSAHFSRTFKSMFGVTPSSIRID